MNQIIEEGRRFASAADMKVSDMSAQAPVGTTLAILERTLKVMSAVHARIHYSFKEELKLLRDIIRDYTPDTYTYEPVEGTPRAKKSDYDNIDVIPVSDPNAATMAQKITQYQAVLQLAQGAPQIYNLPKLHRQMLDVLGIKNAQQLVKLPEDQKPEDPITENQNILMMKPVKAFYYQDHQAHIGVHMAAMQDPKIMQLVGQNPQAQAMQAAMMAHVNEHVAYEYRKQMEMEMGMELPFHPDEQDDDAKAMPQELEVRISQMAARASQALLQRDTNEVRAQQAQQAQQDPIIQMQQQELQLKQGELELKSKKLATDAAAKADQLQIERDRIESQEKIAGMNAQIKVNEDAKNRQSKETEMGAKLGIDLAKSKAQMQQQRKGE
jgi:hypothetical protein